MQRRISFKERADASETVSFKMRDNSSVSDNSFLACASYLAFKPASSREADRCVLAFVMILLIWKKGIQKIPWELLQFYYIACHGWYQVGISNEKSAVFWICCIKGKIVYEEISDEIREKHCYSIFSSWTRERLYPSFDWAGRTLKRLKPFWLS